MRSAKSAKASVEAYNPPPKHREAPGEGIRGGPATRKGTSTVSIRWKIPRDETR